MARLRGEVLTRALHVEGEPVIVHAWQRRGGEAAIRAEGADRERRERAIERVRFALGVDDDLSGFYAEFKRDPLLGPAIRRRPWLRPARRPFAWEAFAWAVTEQLIESSRAARIQRRIVRRWGRRVAGRGERSPLRDVPSAAAIAALAPAQLEAVDLSGARAIALVRCARDVAAGRVDPDDPADDARLLRVREIGPWTVQCLGLHGRGDPDALPAGDLAYLKLVGVLAGLGRRASVPEVERFYARYEPFRGLAGSFSLAHYRAAMAASRGLPLAA